MGASKRFGILGGGIAGLSLSYFLGQDSEVLEKAGETGGLCRSFSKDGFTYDLGGHVIFSKDRDIIDLELSLLGDNVEAHVRRNAIWYKNRFVKYPFENGLSVLDREDIFQCLYHFAYNAQRPQQNFQDWIYNTFGQGLAERYLLPYNKKIWKTEPADMATDWVERIPKPPVEDVLKSALGIETEGYVHQLNFHYPRLGGFESLPRAFQAASQGSIITNFAVRSITRTGSAWLVSNGSEEREYESIICTLPIFQLIKLLPSVPDQVRNAAAALRYNSLIVVLLGLSSGALRERFGVYFPQDNLLFHRICFYGYFGDHYAPAGTSSVVAEVTANEGDEIWSQTDETIVQRVIDGLVSEGFIKKDQVITTDVKRTRFAYVIYDLHRAKNLAIVTDYVRSQGIELCGRFAEFHYVNSDAVIRSAKTLAERLLLT